MYLLARSWLCYAMLLDSHLFFCATFILLSKKQKPFVSKKVVFTVHSHSQKQQNPASLSFLSLDT